jgi:hypothetical protein
MTTINTSNISTIVSGVERNSYDYALAFAETQSSNPTIVAELVQAYTLIAQNLGISAYQFIQQLESKGDSKQQAIYLAAQLNNVRPRNALLGIIPNQTTPQFVAREIAA